MLNSLASSSMVAPSALLWTSAAILAWSSRRCTRLVAAVVEGSGDRISRVGSSVVAFVRHSQGFVSHPCRSTQPLSMRQRLRVPVTWWQNDSMSGVTMEVAEELDVDAARLADVCERYGVAELAVFGSVARGVATPTSDVDLLYVMAPGRSLGFSINRLEDELVAVFGRQVDLVAKRAVHRMLRDHVLAEARTMYAA